MSSYLKEWMKRPAIAEAIMRPNPHRPVEPSLARMTNSELDRAFFQARRARIHAKSLDDMSFAMKREAAIEKELETRAKVSKRVSV